jgi:hypothetical protein
VARLSPCAGARSRRLSDSAGVVDVLIAADLVLVTACCARLA